MMGSPVMLVRFSTFPCFFESPIVVPIGMAMAMGGEKSSAVLPEPRPESLTVSLGHFQAGQGMSAKKFEPAFTMRRWYFRELGFELEEKHQPMTLALISVFA